MSKMNLFENIDTILNSEFRLTARFQRDYVSRGVLDGLAAERTRLLLGAETSHALL
jgi:hypothetical protein